MKKKTSSYRPSPLAIWYQFRRGIPLLFLPLLSLLRPPLSPVSRSASPPWQGTLVLLLLILAVEHRRSQSLEQRGSFWIRTEGMWFRRRHIVPFSAIATAQAERSWLMALFGAVSLTVGTAAHTKKVPFLLRQTQLGPLWHPRRRPLLFPRLWPLIILAVSGSNAMMGLVTLIPLLRWLSKRPGWEQLPAQTMDAFQRFLFEDLSPLLRVLAALLLLGWLVAFCREIGRYAGLCVQRRHTTLYLTGGLLTRHIVLIDLSKITALGLRQTLITGLFGLHTVSLSAAGYGRERGVHPLLLPALRRHTLHRSLSYLCPTFPTEYQLLRPPRRAKRRYALPALIACLFSLLLWRLHPMLAPLCLILCPLFSWWLFIRLWSHRQAGLGLSADGTGCVLCYSRGFALYEQRIVCRYIDRITVTRSPWQRRDGTCTVTVICYGEPRRHTVRCLPYEAVCEILRRIEKRPLS